MRGWVTEGSKVEVEDTMVRFGWLRKNGPGASEGGKEAINMSWWVDSMEIAEKWNLKVMEEGKNGTGQKGNVHRAGTPTQVGWDSQAVHGHRNHQVGNPEGAL